MVKNIKISNKYQLDIRNGYWQITSKEDKIPSISGKPKQNPEFKQKTRVAKNVYEVGIPE